jgi:hypothetical protein
MRKTMTGLVTALLCAGVVAAPGAEAATTASCQYKVTAEPVRIRRLLRIQMFAVADTGQVRELIDP